MKSIIYKGYEIEIEQDDISANENPLRRDEDLMELLYVSDKYILGSRSIKPEEINEVIDDEKNFCVPYFAHVQSGTQISLAPFPFTDPWDSGQCGIVVINVEKAKEEYGNDYKDKVLGFINIKVEEFNRWLDGDIWAYNVRKASPVLGSLAGMYGYDYALNEAKLVVDGLCLKENEHG